MSTAYDALEYTIMSYRSYLGAQTGSLTNTVGHFPQSMMMLDIAAIQTMYGADYTTYAGNTVYKFSPNSGQMYVNGVSTGATTANVVFRTLWDGGGVDLIDLSDYTTSTSVNLDEGGFIIFDTANYTQRAKLGTASGVVQYAQANVYMSLLYQGNTASLIENVTTGSGNDVIAGNAADNRINAGTGTNVVNGMGGNDTVVLATMQTSAATLTVAADGGMTFVQNGTSTTITNVEYVEFSDGTVYNTANLAAAYSALSTSAAVVVDTLYQPAVVIPDTTYYGQTLTLISGTSDADDLSASNMAAVLWGGAGDDYLRLQDGDDVAVGDTGADRFMVDLRGSTAEGTDLIVDLDFSEGDRLYIYTSVSNTFSNSYNSSNSYWTGSAGELGFITSFADLEEVVASDGVTVEDGDYGLILTFTGVNESYHLELAGYSVDMFSSYTLVDGDTVVEAPTLTASEYYSGLGYKSVLGTTGGETLTMKRAAATYEGLDGADRFNWDMRSLTSATHEVILDLDFSEGDWISILTSQSGTFSQSGLSGTGIWTGSSGEMLYLRDLGDVADAVTAGALDAIDGDYGVILSVTTNGYERTLELAGIWTTDLLTA